MTQSDDDSSASQSPLSHTLSSTSSVQEDENTEPGEIKTALVDLLSQLKTSGSFATSKRIAGDVVTGLFLPGVGRIGLPLSHHQAKDIIGTCHPAPFGKGSQTIVDESVRKTWELNPDQFQLCGPSWPGIIEQVAQQASRDLGCPPEIEVRANLYKLLLYEKGALFKPHKDTEKEPGMFATLAITLPSEYEGGEIVTTHCKESKILTAEYPAFFHNYMAWYADVTHEVREIQSGYRIVLVYNLINRSSAPAPSASYGIQKKRELGSILKSWSKAISAGDQEAPDRLIYRLDHKYTEANLSLNRLKSLDKLRAGYLRDACAKAGICFYLASMERSMSGCCDEDDDGGYGRYGGCGGYGRRRCDPDDYHIIEELTEESLALKRLVEADGHFFAEDVSVSEDDIAQEDPFERSPDEEDYEGYTGNAGASATHWYRDTVSDMSRSGFPLAI